MRVPQATGFRAYAAVGVSGAVDGQQVSVGGPGVLREDGARPLPVTESWADEGAIVLHVLRGDMVIGALLMSASRVVVALNAQLLRRLDLRSKSSALPLNGARR